MKLLWLKIRKLNRSPIWRWTSPSGSPMCARRHSSSITPPSRACSFTVPMATPSGRTTIITTIIHVALRASDKSQNGKQGVEKSFHRRVYFVVIFCNIVRLLNKVKKNLLQSQLNMHKYLGFRGLLKQQNPTDSESAGLLLVGYFTINLSRMMVMCATLLPSIFGNDSLISNQR